MRIEFGDREVGFDETKPIDLSIPLIFNGPQPNAYGVGQASSIPCAAGDLVGDTREGGSCNFEQYTFIPHCNGTHTECVGHITTKRISVRDCLQDVLIPTVLISVKPEAPENCKETYPSAAAGDRLLTRRQIEAALSQTGCSATNGSYALVVRTMPNSPEKLSTVYNSDEMPPYFSSEAMRFMVEHRVKHLLVDLPSIDRIDDNGLLSNHRIFWNFAPGSFEIDQTTRTRATITELIFAPDDIADGEYLLNLQIAPFAADASPSRPILFPITL